MGYLTLSQWSLDPNFQSFGRGDWARASTVSRQPLFSYSRDLKPFSLADYQAFKLSRDQESIFQKGEPVPEFDFRVYRHSCQARRDYVKRL